MIKQSIQDQEHIEDNLLLKKIVENTAKLHLINSRKNYLNDFRSDLKWDKTQPKDEYIIVWYEDNDKFFNKYLKEFV